MGNLERSNKLIGRRNREYKKARAELKKQKKKK